MVLGCCKVKMFPGVSLSYDQHVQKVKWFTLLYMYCACACYSTVLTI